LLLGRRIAAYLIDILILFVVLLPAGLLIQRLLPGSPPTTGPAIWRTVLWSFSLPTWLYFVLSDSSAAGATLGKRLVRLRVADQADRRIAPGRALARTAVKLLPWEMIHLSAFGLSANLSQFSPAQTVGVAGANLLAVVYLGLAAATHGRRSVHDLVAGTTVEPAPS
jgi:uncharacterized RDD family membrane protein YckC